MAFALLSRTRGAAQAASKPVNHRKAASGLRAIKFGVSHPNGSAPAIQAKLRIVEANNKFEREADRTADEVMRMPDNVDGELCSACEHQVQRSAQPTAPQDAPVVAPHTESKISALIGGGQPLSRSLRAFFEPRFGCDFSQVRLHSDTQAAHAANEVQARAFTVGTDLMFARGQLSPGTAEGKKLLAHELTHVLQQTSGTVGSPAGGVSASRSPATLQRFSEKACLKTICGLNQCKQIGAALALAIRFVETSIAAMEEKELSGQARDAMLWLFQLDDDSQNAYILKILKTIRDALIRNDKNTDVQCESNCYPAGAGAIVTTPDSKTPGTLQDCADTPCTYKICDSFGGLGPREQAIALVHESGHLSGLSGDVYRNKPQFRLLSQSEALGNAENFALFVRALNGVIKSDLRLAGGASVGIATTTKGNIGWFKTGFFDLTLNRPGFRIFNPKLRLSITGYGVKGSGPDDRLEDPKNSVVVESLLTGVEINKSRGHGGLFGNVLAGVGRAERGGDTSIVFTATADLGYRWDRKEVAIGASYIRDTTAAKDFQNVFLVGVSGNFSLLDFLNK